LVELRSIPDQVLGEMHMQYRNLLNILASFALICQVNACTKSSSGDSEGASGSRPDVEESAEGFRTECGTVQGGKLYNPVNPTDGDRAQARVLGPNLVAIKRTRMEEFVKLHGLDVPGSTEQRNGAEALLEELSGEGEVYFYQTDKTCVTDLDNGTVGLVGQLFSASGKSFSEELIRAGFADVGTDVCSGELIGPCYRALLEESITPTPTPEPEYEGPSTPAGFILWKPVADSDGRLAIHSVPYGTTVRVNGETGTNRGPGNGYGSLARFRKNGCGYGRKPRVELIMSDGSKFMFGDKDFTTVPDGCQRWVIDPKGNAKPNKK
jgi:hypothetical protein